MHAMTSGIHFRPTSHISFQLTPPHCTTNSARYKLRLKQLHQLTCAVRVAIWKDCQFVIVVAVGGKGGNTFLMLSRRVIEASYKFS